jgi:hypothetical protein
LDWLESSGEGLNHQNFGKKRSLRFGIDQIAIIYTILFILTTINSKKVLQHEVLVVVWDEPDWKIKLDQTSHW